MTVTFKPPVWPKHFGPRKGKTVHTSKPKGGRR